MHLSESSQSNKSLKLFNVKNAVAYFSSQIMCFFRIRELIFIVEENFLKNSTTLLVRPWILALSLGIYYISIIYD